MVTVVPNELTAARLPCGHMGARARAHGANRLHVSHIFYLGALIPQCIKKIRAGEIRPKIRKYYVFNLNIFNLLLTCRSSDIFFYMLIYLTFF